MYSSPHKLPKIALYFQVVKDIYFLTRIKGNLEALSIENCIRKHDRKTIKKDSSEDTSVKQCTGAYAGILKRGFHYS